MSKATISYKLGQAYGRLSQLKKSAIFAGILAAGVWAFVGSRVNAPEPQKPVSPEDAAKQACVEHQSRIQGQYEQAMAAGHFERAAAAVRRCAEVDPNSPLLPLLRKAESEDLMAKTNNVALDELERAEAALKLVRVFPEAAEPGMEKWARGVIERRHKVDQETAMKIRRARDVQLGMSKEDVYDGSWGRPRDIKTITTPSGETEIWFYSNSRALRFENGRLAVILR